MPPSGGIHYLLQMHTSPVQTSLLFSSALAIEAMDLPFGTSRES
jgi:hypothetical protein